MTSQRSPPGAAPAAAAGPSAGPWTGVEKLMSVILTYLAVQCYKTGHQDEILEPSAIATVWLQYPKHTGLPAISQSGNPGFRAVRTDLTCNLRGRLVAAGAHPGEKSWEFRSTASTA